MPIIAAHIAFLSIFFGSFGAVVTSALCLMSACLVFLSTKTHTMSVCFIIAFYILLMHGIINMLASNTSPYLFFTAFSSTAAYFLAFYLILKSGISLRHLFSIYIKYAVVVSIFGYLQAVCWVAGIASCYDFSAAFPMNLSPAPGAFFGIRLNSFLFEPSQVAFTMAPIIAVCIFESILPSQDRLTNWPVRAIIIVFVLLSQSSAAYMVILFSIVTAILLSGRLLYLGLTLSISIGLGILIAATPEFLEPSIKKARALVQLVQVGELAREADATTYSIYIHGLLALDNLWSTFLLGGGIGSHEFLYGYLGETEATLHRVASIGTAANLVFRLISELGLLGVVFLVVVFWRGVTTAVSEKGPERLIIIAMLAGIFAFCLRNGAIGAFGLAFYVMVILFGRKFEKEAQQNAHR